uniref:Uncharacterized protein n=1 Tax=Vespula pensylvanica TaxID=30213 RepID=A0A834UAR1_VESPE|nr:hypothetical protein H0235_006552 [Vespula pensylvanica]
MKKYVYSRSGNFLRRRSHAKDGAKVIDQATRLGLTLPALNQQLPFLLENDRAVGTLEKSKGIRSSTKGDPKMTKYHDPVQFLVFTFPLRICGNSSENVPVPSIIPGNDLAVTLIGLQHFFSKKQKSGPNPANPPPINPRPLATTLDDPKAKPTTYTRKSGGPLLRLNAKFTAVYRTNLLRHLRNANVCKRQAGERALTFTILFAITIRSLAITPYEIVDIAPKIVVR